MSAPASGVTARPESASGFSASTKRLSLISAILASTIAAVDSSAVNVALPAIGRDLGGGFAAQQWVSNAYLLTLSALILLAGSLTDRLGERRVFMAGVTGFGIGSGLCAASPSIGVLIVARALQGVSGALLTPSALAIIVAVFPKDERGAAIGKWTAWSGIGILAGPLLGGEIVDVASWRWIFLINVPLVLIALAISRAAVPGRSVDAGQAKLDWTGAALAATGLAGVSFGLIEQPVLGWSDPGVWGALAAGLALFTGFIVYEAHAPAPMLELSLFSHRNFSVANAQTFVMYGGIAMLGFFVTIYLQQVAGYSALKSGVTGLIPTVVMFALSARFGRLADRYGPRPFLTTGPVLVAAGFLLMLRYGTSVSLLTDVLPALLVFSLGLAVTVAPLTATVLADASEADAGIASAINNAIARSAGLIAVAAVGAVVSSYYATLLDQRLGDRLPPFSQAAVQQAKRKTFGTIQAAAVPPSERAFADQATAGASEDAFHLAMGVGAGLLLIAGVGGLGLRGKPEDAATAPTAGAIAATEASGATGTASTARVTGTASTARVTGTASTARVTGTASTARVTGTAPTAGRRLAAGGCAGGALAGAPRAVADCKDADGRPAGAGAMPD